MGHRSRSRYLKFFSSRKVFRAAAFSESGKGLQDHQVRISPGMKIMRMKRKREKKRTSPSGLFMKDCRLLHGLRKIRS
jgi:hypothetical protein